VLFERIFCEPLKIYHGLSFFFLFRFSSFFLERRKKNAKSIHKEILKKNYKLYSNILLTQFLKKSQINHIVRGRSPSRKKITPIPKKASSLLTEGDFFYKYITVPPRIRRRFSAEASWAHFYKNFCCGLREHRKTVLKNYALTD